MALFAGYLKNSWKNETLLNGKLKSFAHIIASDFIQN